MKSPFKILGNFNTPHVKVSFGVSIIMHGMLFLLVWQMTMSAAAKKEKIDNVDLQTEIEEREKIIKIIKEKEPPKPEEPLKKPDTLKDLLFKPAPKPEEKLLDILKVKMDQKKLEEMDKLVDRKVKNEQLDKLNLQELQRQRDEALKDLSKDFNKPSKMLDILNDRLNEKQAAAKPQENSAIMLNDVGIEKVKLTDDKIAEIQNFRSRTVHEVQNVDDADKLKNWQRPTTARNTGDVEVLNGIQGVQLGHRSDGGGVSDVLTADQRAKVNKVMEMEKLIETAAPTTRGTGGVPAWLQNAGGSGHGGSINVDESSSVPRAHVSVSGDVVSASDSHQLNTVREAEKPVELRGELANRARIRDPLPSYPKWALDQQVEADVEIYFTVSPDGHVRSDMSVERTSGYGDLDRLARETLNQWVFVALPADNKQIQNGMIKFKFRLQWQ